MSIPVFTADGLLPEGDHRATFDELRASHLVTGDGSGWDMAWRLTLVNNAETLVSSLWEIGIKHVYLDGSFVEDVPHPKDIDGYFECDKDKFLNGEYARQLNALGPKPVWDWRNRVRVPIAGSKSHGELPMWIEYRVELYGRWAGQQTGIRDQAGRELDFADAFRQQKWTCARKGVVKIVR